MKVLVIDDEPDVGEVVTLCFNLRWPEAQVVSAYNAKDGLAQIRNDSPDVVILDIGLPDMDGFDVCREVRRFSEVPIIMLTARDAELDKVKGLEWGADDYITKPFSHIELLARVRAVLRRTSSQLPEEEEPPFEAGRLRINYASREVYVDGAPVKLTPIEFSLLYHLTRNVGRVLTTRTLLAKVWGREYINEVDYLKVHIQHLRQKLGDKLQDGAMIVNERGVGYKLVLPRS